VLCRWAGGAGQGVRRGRVDEGGSAGDPVRARGRMRPRGKGTVHNGASLNASCDARLLCKYGETQLQFTPHAHLACP
jgi:hypothetical protein